MQAQLFRGGVVFGVNFNQVEGDDVSGYKHVGFNGGFTVDMQLKETLSLSMEFLYTVKGSSTGSNFTLDDRLFSNTFRYVEVPLYVQYHDPKGMSFGAGLAVARMLSLTHIEDTFETPEYFEETAPLFIPAPNNMDIGILANVSYRVKPYLWLNMRGTVSIPQFYERYSFNRGGPAGWRNNSIYLRTVFVFSALGKKRK